MSDAAPLHELGGRALDELRAVIERMPADAVERFCDELLAARRIACYGCGREGLMLRALVMRLMHLGLDAHVVGDMTTPPLGPGDLLVTTAGPGHVTTVETLMGVARAAGARTLLVTAQPDGPAARLADALLVIPAQTMADDRGGQSALPMGSAFEAAELVVFDLASVALRGRTGQSAEEMRGRHTNLE